MANSICIAVLMLLIANFCYTSADTPGINSITAVSNGLNLPAVHVFTPITDLTAKLHLDKPASVFVHYQITMHTPNSEVFTQLTMNGANAGSIVSSGLQTFKSATGFHMANLNPGDYVFEVRYHSSVIISMRADWDWQTAILNVISFEDAHVESDGINCPTTVNNRNNWGPIEGVDVVLNLPEDRVVLSAYQLAPTLDAPGHVVTSLVVDGFFYNTATILKGNTQHLDLHGTWARQLYTGPHEFNIYYRTPYDTLYFSDCIVSLGDHRNLYAMMLPSTCKEAAVIRPETTFTFSNSNQWALTDIIHYLVLSEPTFVIVMYQYSGQIAKTYMVMRLSIDLEAQNHTASLTGNTLYVGNFGLWQGTLSAGSHQIIVEYRSPAVSENTVSDDLEWERYNKWMNREMTVITC